MGNLWSWLFGGEEEVDQGRVRRGNVRVSGPVTLDRLHALSQERGAIRAGSTVDPRQRSYGYKAEGYSGTLHYAWTDNMREAENDLLQNHAYLHNVHNHSNSAAEEGFVYVIKGRRYQ